MTMTNLSKALELWQSITGVSPESESLNSSQWAIYKTYTEIKEAIDLDPSEITANLLLSFFVRSHLAKPTFSLLDLIEGESSIDEKLRQPKELLSILESPQIKEVRSRFIERLTKALEKYGALDREDVQKELCKHDQIAILRRDALKSISHLRVDQFRSGRCEPSDIAPVYNKTVHQWWNINSLLEASAELPSGVTLNLIRQPNLFQSYFCFSVKNGENLYIITDAPDEPHPLFGSMSRRPDRRFSERAGKNWFPYELMDIGYDEESGRLFEEESSKRSLVTYQKAAIALKDIKDLDPLSLIWISMMFDLIIEKFWRRDLQLKELSYTGAMIQSHQELIEASKSSNGLIKTEDLLSLPSLTLRDVASENVSENDVGDKHDQPNLWMEKRYAHKVDERTLNQIGLPGKKLFLSNRTSEIIEKPATTSNRLLSLEERELQRIELARLDATTFGTKEKLNQDRVFLARYNMATQINVLAQDEYNARKDQVMQWVHTRVNNNLDTLLQWVNGQNVYAPKLEKQFGTAHPRVFLSINATKSYFEYMPYAISLGLKESTGRQLCALNETIATYQVQIYPTNATELALLAGCNVEDLPDVLQHWTSTEGYYGNNILDRIDPMVWHAKNPWRELKFKVQFALSKRAMNQLEKQPKLLPPIEGAFYRDSESA